MMANPKYKPMNSVCLQSKSAKNVDVERTMDLYRFAMNTIYPGLLLVKMFPDPESAESVSS